MKNLALICGSCLALSLFASTAHAAPTQKPRKAKAKLSSPARRPEINQTSTTPKVPPSATTPQIQSPQEPPTKPDLPVAEEKVRGGKAEWNASLGGKFSDDDISEAKIAGLYGNLRGEYRFSHSLTTNVEVGVALETGTTQSLFTDEFRPEQQIYLTDARVNWLPWDFFSFHAGAINQRHHGSPFFIGGKTFPALMQVLSLPGLGPYAIRVVAQEAIPTSQTFSQKSIGKEPTPTFYTGRLELEYKDNDGYLLAARGTYFRFRNLTRGVAQDSRFYGNNVLGAGVVGARFFYEFEGWEGGLKAEIPVVRRVKVMAGNSFVNNTKAPKTKNQALAGYLGADFEFDSFNLRPTATIFRIEDDPIPGYYSSKQYGHNNRKGWAAHLAVYLKNEKVTIEGLYVRANTINLSPRQADRNFMQVQISTDFQTL